MRNYGADIINEGRFVASFVGVDMPKIGRQEIVPEMRQIISGSVTIDNLNDAVEQYKVKFFEELNQMGVFYMGRQLDNGDIELLTIRVYDIKKSN